MYTIHSFKSHATICAYVLKVMFLTFWCKRFSSAKYEYLTEEPKMDHK